MKQTLLPVTSYIRSYLGQCLQHILMVLAASLFAAQLQAAEHLTNAALPKRVMASYEVTKNGQPFARVHERFEVNGQRYQIESVTKGIGVYALFGERVLQSRGALTHDGLQPEKFELRQGDNPKRALLAEFDWAKLTLRMTAKGKAKDVPLSVGTQDLASFGYQFMYRPEVLKDVLTVTLTTGKKLNEYHYNVAEVAPLHLAGNEYKVLHLAPQSAGEQGQETKELWLAADYHYLPVKILLVDENGQKLEQVLTELHIE